MQIEARNLSVEDYDGLVETMKRAYPTMADYIWPKKA